MMFCEVDTYFVRWLESDDGSWAKMPSVNNKNRKTKYFPGVFNQAFISNA